MIARLITRFPRLAKGFIESYRPWESEGDIPWTPPSMPLRDCRLALVTTAGVHHPEQPPFDMQDRDGDPSFRELDGERISKNYRITHDYYDHSDAEEDLNIVLPLQRLQELVNEGVLGNLNQRHFGFMGHIDGRHIPTLIETSAREVAGKLCTDEVDLVLLTPA